MHIGSGNHVVDHLWISWWAADQKLNYIELALLCQHLGSPVGLKPCHGQQEPQHPMKSLVALRSLYGQRRDSARVTGATAGSILPVLLGTWHWNTGSGWRRADPASEGSSNRRMLMMQPARYPGKIQMPANDLSRMMLKHTCRSFKRRITWHQQLSLSLYKSTWTSEQGQTSPFSRRLQVWRQHESTSPVPWPTGLNKLQTKNPEHLFLCILTAIPGYWCLSNQAI